jgi:hypothetical protein
MIRASLRVLRNSSQPLNSDLLPTNRTTLDSTESVAIE